MPLTGFLRIFAGEAGSAIGGLLLPLPVTLHRFHLPLIKLGRVQVPVNAPLIAVGETELFLTLLLAVGRRTVRVIRRTVLLRAAAAAVSTARTATLTLAVVRGRSLVVLLAHRWGCVGGAFALIPLRTAVRSFALVPLGGGVFAA